MSDSKSFRLPAEWEAQDGVLLAWPHKDTDWADNLDDVIKTYSALIAAISQHQFAVVCVAHAALELEAQKLLTVAGAAMNRVRFVTLEYNDTWLRDSGPISMCDGENFQLLDFHFTGWGGKFEASDDDRIIEQLFAQQVFQKATRVRHAWAIEGGAIESDGLGTILSTWRCLRHRHGDNRDEQIKQELAGFLNASRVLVLEHGYLEGDDTDAHIDTLARLVSPTQIVYQACADPDDSHFSELAKMGEELAALKTADGAAYQLHALPWCPPIVTESGRRLAASYANFLIINGAVLMPTYANPETDLQAKAVLQAAMPQYKIIGIACRSLIEQNGSLHCITMQLPKGVLRVD